MKRVLIVSNDYVGAAMAGPGIRYFHFAKELAKRFAVTLMIPNEGAVDLADVDVIRAPKLDHRRFKQLLAGFDVVLAQRLGPREMKFLAKTDKRVVYDLYDPLMMENLELFSPRDGESEVGEAAYELTNLSQKMALATGDAFICASERQRDLWLGALAAVGRLDLERYRHDASLRTLIDVVPFGLEPEPPVATRRVLKGVVPGIRERDKVLLWGGGIWSWLDPLTVIRAVKEVSAVRDDVKLVFLGAEHPNPTVARMTMAEQARALARELGLEDRFVFFKRGWVPYRERGDYLLEADLGVSAHFDTVETRFAFRTRVIDYLWAGLPVVTTEGDVLADLVAGRRLGRAVGFEDVDGWARAITGLLDDEREYRRARANVAEAREEFAWPRVVEPLAALVEARGSAVRSSENPTAMVVAQWKLRARISFLRRGVLGSAATLARAVGGKAGRALAGAGRASAFRRAR